MRCPPTFQLQVEGGIYDWRLCFEGCLTDWCVPYRPLRHDSRTPGICSGPYDDVVRTTCGRIELLRCREGSYAREGSWPVLYGRGQFTSL
ncbi:hypothetical protein K443DRAFT_540994 [Laccaria amethystina LaAM-08-1]|uniref:Unplaced genomic scaffold K443scaffold_624, whole genome shotgun sequence n=1 Tax=Laccaria amethystina LaAM-08-1 TaxID=1095629 RepID=A0A0C9WYY6_9AGAR|nr:hypothetical protein K443DRAFT_540994 [Laccaria amethystina LaAM-08-1]